MKEEMGKERKEGGKDWYLPQLNMGCCALKHNVNIVCSHGWNVKNEIHVLKYDTE